ncbi:MAG: hypothetical protein B7733_19035 [Myxococcales bacterium FL481]|nr:MAG: hypothetical protein B7733_19035 [Myxococcales bacterium FL481]
MTEITSTRIRFMSGWLALPTFATTALLLTSCVASGQHDDESAMAEARDGIAPSAWCRGVQPAPVDPAEALFSPDTSETYAGPQAIPSAFPRATFGETDGRGTMWLNDNPATAENEELELLCRLDGVPRSQDWAGECDGADVDLDPTIDVQSGCLRLRYVRNRDCTASRLVDDEVRDTALVYRRGYVTGDTNDSPTDFRAFQRPTNELGEHVAVADATVRARFNARTLQETLAPQEAYAVYNRYVSEDDHYVAMVRRTSAATTCDSGHVVCDPFGQVLEVQAELVIAEKLCGGQLVELASVPVPLREKGWAALEFTALGSELYASVTMRNWDGFPVFRQLHVDLDDEAVMDARRTALELPALTREEYPADLPAGTSGVSIHNLAAYLDDWTVRDAGTTVCRGDQALTPLRIDADVDMFGAGEPQPLCPGWGYVVEGGDCNDAERTFRPGAPEPCGFEDFNCDGVVQDPASCPAVAEPPQRAGEGEGLVLDDFLAAQERWVGRINGSVTPGALTYSTDLDSPRADHEIVTMSTPGDGRRIEIEQRGITPGWSFCDETTPYLVPDNPATPEFDGVPNLKYVPKIWIRVENEHQARDLALYMGDESFQNYYRLRFRSGQGEVYVTDGDWVGFSLSLENLLVDPVGSPDPCNISRARVRVWDFADEAVTVHLDALTKVPRSTDFPTGVVSLTFDDGYDSIFDFAAPCLDGTDAACLVDGGLNDALPATVFPIISALGMDMPEDELAFMSEADLASLRADGWDVGMHGFAMDAQNRSYANTEPAAVLADIRASKQWLHDTFGPGSGYENMAYPKGEFNANLPGEFNDAIDTVRNEFTSARTINWQMRELPAPSDMHKLRVLYVTRTMSVEQVREAVEVAERNAEWVIMVFHHFVDTVEERERKNYFMLREDFRAIIRMLREPGRTAVVRNVSDVISDRPLLP